MRVVAILQGKIDKRRWSKPDFRG